MKNIIKTFVVTIIAIATIMTVSATASAASFTDVSDKQWYAPAVEYCNANGYMSGTGAGKFDPNGRVSRAQMAQILYNFAGKPSISGATNKSDGYTDYVNASGIENPFYDVPSNAWYTKAVLFAKATKIVSGTSSTTYSPNAYITREQVAVMLMGYHTASGKTATADTSVLNGYTDGSKVSSWAQKAVAWALQNSIMSGTGNSKLDPKATCTRAQLAQFIKNYCRMGTPSTITLDDYVKPILPDIPGFPEDGEFEPLPKDWLPEGGYVQGGRKYNQFGIDITGVDGVPNTDDIHVMAMINQYRVSKGLPELKWSRHFQVMSEIRARETEYNCSNPNGTNTVYGTPHLRPDGSKRSKQMDLGTEFKTGTELMIAELKSDDMTIDPGMMYTDKVINKNNFWYGIDYENLSHGSFNHHTDLASQVFVAWKNSPGHEAAFVKNYDNRTGYFAVCVYYNPNIDLFTAAYNTAGLEWIDSTSRFDPPVVEDPTEWYPGKGVDYSKLGFDVTDIPDEYDGYVEREYSMTPEEYGPTDHTAEAVSYWLWDNGIEKDSNLDVQIEAHYYANMGMDDFVKFAISRTTWFHWTMVDADFLAGSPAWEITENKAQVVQDVADKLAYNHFVRTTATTGSYGCHVCLHDHDELRDLSAAEAVVNQFFMDTYGVDISAY